MSIHSGILHSYGKQKETAMMPGACWYEKVSRQYEVNRDEINNTNFFLHLFLMCVCVCVVCTHVHSHVCGGQRKTCRG